MWGIICGCHENWNGLANDVYRMVHGVQQGATQRAVILLWEYVEETPAKEEVGCVHFESHVTLVELKTQLRSGQRHNGGHVENILGCTYVEMYWAILCQQQWMRLQSINATPLFVSTNFLLEQGGGIVTWLYRGRHNPQQCRNDAKHRSIKNDNKYGCPSYASDSK